MKHEEHRWGGTQVRQERKNITEIERGTPDTHDHVVNVVINHQN